MVEQHTHEDLEERIKELERLVDKINRGIPPDILGPTGKVGDPQ